MDSELKQQVDYALFCLKKARWCVNHSPEPQYTVIAWLNTASKTVDKISENVI